MAAGTEVELEVSKLKDHLSNPVYTTSLDGESFSTDAEDQQDYVVKYLEKELGIDLKSMRNVGDLLEKLREENNVLEGQVNQQLCFFFSNIARIKLHNSIVFNRSCSSPYVIYYVIDVTVFLRESTASLCSRCEKQS